MPSYIKDGYTETAYIAEVPRLHGALRFKYRPALIEDSSALFEEAAKKPARQAERITARFLRDRISEWDLKDQDDNPVPVTVDNLLRLNRSLANRIHQIVMGLGASDEGDPVDLESDAKN